ncbi:hypothetical protein ABPG74_012022 [Tetrahymena malaccensis]
MRLFLTIYYLKADQSFIYFITILLTFTKEHQGCLFSYPEMIEAFQTICIQHLCSFQILLLLKVEYRLSYAVLSFMLILDIVFVKILRKIQFSMYNWRENDQYKQKQPILTLRCIYSIFGYFYINHNMYTSTYYFYKINFIRMFCLFEGIAIFILNNIYLFSIEGSDYKFLRIYFTLLVISLIPKIKQETLFLRNFLQNGPIIDVWNINNFDIQQLDSYDQKLTQYQQKIILGVQNFNLEYQSCLCCLQKFVITEQNNYQKIEQYWGFILNLLFQTNKSFAIQITKEKNTVMSQPFFYEIDCQPYILDLEKKKICFDLKQNFQKLNQAILNQYKNQFFDFGVVKFRMDYYEDYFLPILIEKYKLLTVKQNISGDSSSIKKYNKIKYSFVGPVISYFVLKKFTSQYYFAIRSQALFNDLYY